MATILHWRDFSAGQPYHAALVPIDARRKPAPHSHADFHEIIYVTNGSGVQWIDSGAQGLTAGDLVLIRPHDRHDFTASDPGGLQFINVAFSSPRWQEFTHFARIAAAAGWESAPGPVLVHDAGPEVARMMAATLAELRAGARDLDLVRLWTSVVPALESAYQAPDERPPWLVRACAAMYAEENLASGLPRLRALASVSPGHLARSMAAFFGCSPVEFVNRVRLEHAANLLSTTTDPIGAVAERCGYSSHAYFCARFHDRFGTAPREYRDQARRAVVP